ncbi:MAG: 1-deoxy-D-xylulose-5-phosphate synthase [Pseudomonadota bacterium]
MTDKQSLLESVSTPADVRALDKRALHQLAEELRDFLLNSVSATGGHLFTIDSYGMLVIKAILIKY